MDSLEKTIREHPGNKQEIKEKRERIVEAVEPLLEETEEAEMAKNAEGEEMGISRKEARRQLENFIQDSDVEGLEKRLKDDPFKIQKHHETGWELPEIERKIKEGIREKTPSN